MVLPTLAAASKALEGVLDKDDINLFFDSMLTGRIYRRTLVANHMHLNSVFEKVGLPDCAVTVLWLCCDYAVTVL